jgi:hypothetical protein
LTGFLFESLQIGFILLVAFTFFHALFTLFLVVGISLRFELLFAPITEERR